MSNQWEARLSELGVTVPDFAMPIASYVPAVRSGWHVYTAGQLPLVAGQLPVTGKVGLGPGQVPPDVAMDLARTATLNALAAIRLVMGSLDRVQRIVKVTGYIASAPDFVGQPAVLNGASNLLEEVFGSAGVHARSAVGVAVLPLDSPVEVELLVEVGD